MRRRKSHGGDEDNAEIDLTPMLDVVFIMLIFFIVTASFVKEKTIEVDIPENTKQQPSEPDPAKAAILVKIDSSDEIYMDERRIDVRAVRANIERLHAERPKAPVVVKAEAGSTAKMFVAVADAAREANVYDVSLIPPAKIK